MHMRLLAGSAALVLFASVVACSSSKSADPTATDEPAQTAADQGAADGTPVAPAAASQPPPSDAPPPAPADDAGSPDGAAVGSDAAGGGGPPNPQCEATSIHESGSNDTEATANAIPAATGTYCGSLDSATDVDVVTFTLPLGTKSLGFGLSYDAQGIEVEGTAGGETFLVGGTPAFKPGQKYVLKVRSTGANSVSYLLSVEIQQ
ncbi:MAG: hypothetical protein JWO86_6987 [Myxococcaceae bacterium]|nr:hypothetical protein [Myxococcaceae bacterium]